MNIKNSLSYHAKMEAIAQHYQEKEDKIMISTQSILKDLFIVTLLSALIASFKGTINLNSSNFDEYLAPKIIYSFAQLLIVSAFLLFYFNRDITLNGNKKSI